MNETRTEPRMRKELNIWVVDANAESHAGIVQGYMDRESTEFKAKVHYFEGPWPCTQDDQIDAITPLPNSVVLCDITGDRIIPSIGRFKWERYDPPEAVAAIKRINKAAKVVIFTGLPYSAEEAFIDGANGYINKFRMLERRESKITLVEIIENAADEPSR